MEIVPEIKVPVMIVPKPESVNTRSIGMRLLYIVSYKRTVAKCAICEKSVHFGNNVSHSNRKSSKMWKSNVKSVRVKTENGGVKKMYVCTNCLKSGRVERA